LLLLMDPLAGCGGAPPPAVDSISRAGYLSCPNDNAVHDRSGHPGGYHNPGWKKMPSGLAVDAGVYTVYVATRSTTP
jgi:hypothetical protein